MTGVWYFRDSEFPDIEIKSCSDSVHSSKKHAHEELSIGLVEKGISVNEYEGQMFEASPGYLVIIPPEVIHKCSPQSYGCWQFKMLYIRPSWLKVAFGLQTIDYISTVKMLDKNNLKQTTNLFRILLSKLPTIQKESCLIRELPRLLSFGFLLEGDQESFDNHNIRALKLSREYMEDNYLDRITLDNLANVSGLSKYHLIRLFNKMCGISPHGYLTMLRINHAKKELLKNISIAEVAANVGFYDQSHFSKTFKQYLGITPDYYRRA
ncbi:AraC family transcriptional regulator [Desulfosporosinus lacus]|uniref:AraC-type DNA-binding protein n=1 Tax=Desulfosporosinus lacus DSM 15449 TaxID=1121420 RepID=A0A1M6FVB0_9FIRM|nr:AraC family transcriptional regulator [Desulfosporosinus lacus]SHJ01645.1 AraC-type DNA-binding protein [Desulfosporosinus lacus DSM 15449]